MNSSDNTTVYAVINQRLSDLVNVDNLFQVLEIDALFSDTFQGPVIPTVLPDISEHSKLYLSLLVNTYN